LTSPIALDTSVAVEHNCALATRDARAKVTYETIGVQVVIVD